MTTSPIEAAADRELEVMALDPDIQREIAAIDAEFALAENDGLDAVRHYLGL
jgi:hypothetical protein